MYGYLELNTSKRWRSLLSGEQVHGMALLKVQVPAPENLGEKALRRRVRRAGERLWEQGVNRVLVDMEFSTALWEPLEEVGLVGVEVETLCQSEAERLALALLGFRGIDPAKATVCLFGSYAGGAVQRTAERLAKQVGQLMIDCPGRGDALAYWLRREYGLPLVEPGSLNADLTVSFSSERICQKADLRLYGQSPDLGGLCLRPRGWRVPERFEPLPLMAALRDCGLLGEVEAVMPNGAWAV